MKSLIKSVFVLRRQHFAEIKNMIQLTAKQHNQLREEKKAILLHRNECGRNEIFFIIFFRQCCKIKMAIYISSVASNFFSITFIVNKIKKICSTKKTIFRRQKYKETSGKKWRQKKREKEWNEHKQSDHSAVLETSTRENDEMIDG